MKRILGIVADYSLRAYLDDLLVEFGYYVDWASRDDLIRILLETNTYQAVLLDGAIHNGPGSLVGSLHGRYRLPILLLADEPDAADGERPAGVQCLSRAVSPSRFKSVLDGLSEGVAP